MALHEWRVSLLDGKQSARVSRQGIEFRGKIHRWDDLTEVGFVRYQTRGGLNEELSLFTGPDDRLRLQWTGQGRNRADWRAFLVDFAQEGARRRPDLTIRDGPNAAEQQTARWIGLAVAAIAATIMIVVLLSGPGLPGILAGLWIGIVGMIVGGVIYGHYSRRDPPPEIDWATFAKREGQDGELPAN